MFNSTRHTLLITLIFLLFACQSSLAQTTAFTYQGKLADNNNPASGQFDFQFKLFDTATVGTGTQQGAMVPASNVTVTAGIFTVQLDFGACPACFNGQGRFLEIAVKPTSGATFTTLSPRQAITATPYAIKTQNMTFNGPFNDGTTIFTATNTFAGDGAGVNTTPDPPLTSGIGKFNAFYGAGAGKANTTGTSNAFFGYGAGAGNLTGGVNAFFGNGAGFFNTSSGNTFIGSNTGEFCCIPAGGFNTILGYNAHVLGTVTNSTAIGARAIVTQSNSLILGSINGENAATADTNVGIGTTAPASRLHVSGTGIIRVRVNSVDNAGLALTLGDQPKWSVATVTGGQFQIFNDAIGQNAVWIDSANNNVGIGTTAPAAKLQVVTANDTNPGVIAAWDGRHFVVGGTASTGGIGMSYDQTNGVGYIEALSPNVAWKNLVIQSGGGRVGIGTASPLDTLDVNGVLRLGALGSSGGTQLCRNLSNQISNCSSSIRYKTNIATLHTGLSIINRLRLVTFDWKQGGEHDLGLVAEEVAKVEPLLVIHNDKGEVEGVKYDRVGVLLINAVKEQQAQIDKQNDTIKRQQAQIEALKKLVCLDHPEAEMCKP